MLNLTGNSDNDEADILVNQADLLENEQQVIVESADIEQEYNNLLKDMVAQKQLQVGRIEEKLGQLLQQQQFKMQKLQMAKPNFFSLPKSKKVWRKEVSIQKSTVSKIENRLMTVKEIKSGMGLHESKLDELAAKKLRKKHAKLCKAFDTVKSKERGLNQAKKQQDKTKVKKTYKSLQRAKSSPL